MLNTQQQKSIRKHVAQLKTNWGNPQCPIDCMTLIQQNMQDKCLVFRSPITMSQDVAAFYLRRDDVYMLITGKTPGTQREYYRINYILAHLIAHIFLPEMIGFEDLSGKQVEEAAESFALELLVPKRALEHVENLPAETLSKIFSVPASLISLRKNMREWPESDPPQNESMK